MTDCHSRTTLIEFETNVREERRQRTDTLFEFLSFLSASETRRQRERDSCFSKQQWRTRALNVLEYEPKYRLFSSEIQ